MKGSFLSSWGSFLVSRRSFWGHFWVIFGLWACLGAVLTTTSKRSRFCDRCLLDFGRPGGVPGGAFADNFCIIFLIIFSMRFLIEKSAKMRSKWLPKVIKNDAKNQHRGFLILTEGPMRNTHFSSPSPPKIDQTIIIFST